MNPTYRTDPDIEFVDMGRKATLLEGLFTRSEFGCSDHPTWLYILSLFTWH